MATLNLMDFLILIIFGVSILVGFGRGLVREVISIVTIIAAFFIAITFTNQLATALGGNASVQTMIDQSTNMVGTSTAQPASYAIYVIAFAILFVGTLIIGSILSRVLNLAFQGGVLGIGNRLLGGVFGFVRGFFLNLILIFVVQLTPMGSGAMWAQSQFVQSFQPAVGWLSQLAAPTLNNIKGKMEKTMHDTSDQLDALTK